MERNQREGKALATVDNYGRRRDDGLEVDTPIGWKFRARGPVVISVVIAAAVVGALAWLIRDHDSRSSERQNEQSSQMKQIAERIDEMVYVQTLPDEKRRELRLDMPESLRRKMARQ